MDSKNVQAEICSEHQLASAVSLLATVKAASFAVEELDWSAIAPNFNVQLRVDDEELIATVVVIIDDGAVLLHDVPNPDNEDERVCTFFVVRHAQTELGAWTIAGIAFIGDGSSLAHQEACEEAARLIFAHRS